MTHSGRYLQQLSKLAQVNYETLFSFTTILKLQKHQLTK